MNKSKHRFKFQKTRYLERKKKEGKEQLEEVLAMLDYFDSVENLKELQEKDIDWQKNNLEYDLRTSPYICEKAKKHEYYAQNLYAALCNNDFIKNDIWELLTEKNQWHCSWRYAGGIVADILEQGDYIDWYCSGIRDTSSVSNEQYNQMTKEQQERYLYIQNKFVREGEVTDEIKSDLFKLGWLVVGENFVDK